MRQETSQTDPLAQHDRYKGDRGHLCDGQMAPRAHTRRIVGTYMPPTARRYNRPQGPWHVPTLDQLGSRLSGEVVDGRYRLSPDQLEALVATVAGGLAKAGARRYTAVSWQLPNSLLALVLYRACWRIGAVASPVHHSMGSSEVSASLEQVQPSVVLEAPKRALSDPVAIAELFGGAPVPSGAVRSQPFDPAVVLFTSGSTGSPKAVLHTNRSLACKALLMSKVHEVGAADAVLMPAPLAHVSGLLNGVLLPGACAMRSVLMGRFDPVEALELVQREHITFMAGPPTFFVSMTAALSDSGDAPRSVSSLRLISTGGASVTPAFVQTTAEAFSCRVKRTYGSTEAPTITTSLSTDPISAARDTDGRALGEVELRITDPLTGKQLSPGDQGELVVRGPELFAGYVDKDQTLASIARGGWFRTGDLATLDPDGWLKIAGRLKDLIIRGGENIPAAQVEAVLESHPSVRQAVVVGYPDELMGERVAAFVVLQGEFSLDMCREWFKKQGVARFKAPERIVTLDHLPLLGSGKPDRAKLAKLAACDIPWSP